MGLRFDVQEIGSFTHTPQGGLRIPAFLTRTGVFQYRNADGSIRNEYRPPDELFKPEVLEAVKASPLTNDHPYADGGRVDAANFTRLAVGHVGDDVRQHEDGVRMAATVYVQDADTVAAVESGSLREISLGYRVYYDPTPGETPDGEKYDGVQRNIRPNHTALVARGRAGREVGLRLDSAGDQIPQNRKISVKITIGGKEYEAGTPEAIAAQAAQDQRLDALEKQLAAFATAAVKAKREKVLTASKRVARVTLDARGLEIREDADDSSVMIEALKKVAPAVPVDGMSPDYVSGAFAVALDFLMRQAAQAGAPVDDGDGADPEDAADAATDGAAGAAQTRIDRFDLEDDGEREDADDLSPSQRARQKMISKYSGMSRGKN